MSIDKTEEQESEEYWRKVEVEQVRLNSDLVNAGFPVQQPIGYVYGLENFEEDVREAVTRVMMEHSEYRYCSATKDKIYRYFACANWLRGTLRDEVVDLLFKHFEIEEMEFNVYDTEKMVLAKSREPYTQTDNIRWVVGLALRVLLNPKLVSHRRYQEKLSYLLHNKKYNKGRSELVRPYARMAKQAAIPKLIQFLSERDLLHGSISELGKLRAMEAKPYLEHIIQTEEPYFRDMAKCALKKIDRNS